MQDKMKNNLLKVNVFMRTKNVKHVEETPTYDFITTLYAIGGAVSLFLGISISMLFEVFELVADILINLANYSSVPSAQKKNKKPHKGRKKQ